MNRLKTFPTEDVAADVLVEVRDQIRRDEAQAAADEATRRRAPRAVGPTPSDAQEDLEEAARRGHAGPGRGPRRGPRPLRGLAEVEGRSRDQGRGPLRPGDVGLRRRCRRRRDQPGAGREPLEGSRPASRDYLVSRDAGERAAALEQLQTTPLPERPGQTGRDPQARRPDPARDPDDAAARRERRSGRSRASRSSIGSATTRTSHPTEYAVLLPPEYHPLRSYPAVVALHDGEGPEAGDRLVGGRGRRAGLHRDRPGVQPARPGGRLPLHDERARRRRAGPARRPAAVRHRRRPRLPRRPVARRRHGLGLRPGPSRPVRRRGDRSRACPFKYAYRYQSARRAAPPLRRPGRPGAGGPTRSSSRTCSSR